MSMGKVKYFFWSTVSSATMLIATSFSPKAQQTLLNTVSTFKQQLRQRLPSSIQDRMPANALSPDAPPVASEAGAKQVSASSNEYLIDNANYVLIEGHYYPARADNTYMINGRKVFYVNNRHAEAVEAAKKVAQAESESGSAPSAAEGSSASTSTDGTSRAVLNGDKLPASPADMMNTLQNAQKAMKQRDDMLKLIEKDQ
jgi:hypothetical protein